jgi:hypothetical protein
MLPDSKVVAASPHNISVARTVDMGKDLELLVLFTSSVGFCIDLKIAEMMNTEVEILSCSHEPDRDRQF